MFLGDFNAPGNATFESELVDLCIIDVLYLTTLRLVEIHDSSYMSAMLIKVLPGSIILFVVMIYIVS